MNMSSSADNFWSAVGRWCRTKPKPEIFVEYARLSLPTESWADEMTVEEFSRSGTVVFNGERLRRREIDFGDADIRCGSVDGAEVITLFRAMWMEVDSIRVRATCVLTERNGGHEGEFN